MLTLEDRIMILEKQANHNAKIQRNIALHLNKSGATIGIPVMTHDMKIVKTGVEFSEV